MLKFIVEHHNNNNVLVDILFVWRMRALSFSISASRAVDLVSKPVFQEQCSRMTGDLPAWKDLTMERLAKSCDRRIPTVLLSNGIDLHAKDLDNSIKEVNTTEIIWSIMTGFFAEHRLRVGVYRIKCAHSVGYGKGLTGEEEALLKPRFSLQ